MKHRKLKTVTLGILTGFLALTSCAVVCGDVVLARVYQDQRRNAALAAGATPLPVLSPTPSPTPGPTSTLRPMRYAMPGDIIHVRFPDYDTGTDAEYSYQSDELRIAVNTIQEEGVTYHVADIWMRNINCFRTAFASGKFNGRREDAEKIARDNNAILAVNGDFLGGLVLRNGELYRMANLRPTPTPAPTPEPLLDPFQNPVLDPALLPTPVPTEPPRPERATCVLYADGAMATEEYDSFRSRRAMENGAWQGWQFGPTLVRDGEPADDVKKQGRSPRCIIGYYEPGHYCLIVIDGRQKDYSIGMNFHEMIDLCMRLGLKEAYNLDGGASAMMVWDGKIISNPPGGEEDARNLPDMIVIGEYLDPEGLFEFVPEIDPTPTPAPTPARSITPEENP